MGSETIKNKFTSEEIYYALHVVFLFGVLTIIYLHFNATARFVLSPETLQYDVPYLQQLTMNLLMDLTAVFLFGSSLPISPKKYGYLRLISLNLAIICFVSYQNLVPLEMYIRFDLLYFPVLIIGSLILILISWLYENSEFELNFKQEINIPLILLGISVITAGYIGYVFFGEISLIPGIVVDVLKAFI